MTPPRQPRRRAARTATPESDLDAGVLCAHPLSADRRRALIHDLGQCTGRPVDLVDLRTAGVPVLREALRHGVCLFCRDRRAYDGLVSRLPVDTEDFLLRHPANGHAALC